MVLPHVTSVHIIWSVMHQQQLPAGVENGTLKMIFPAYLPQIWWNIPAPDVVVQRVLSRLCYCRKRGGRTLFVCTCVSIFPTGETISLPKDKSAVLQTFHNGLRFFLYCFCLVVVCGKQVVNFNNLQETVSMWKLLRCQDSWKLNKSELWFFAIKYFCFICPRFNQERDTV